MRWALSLFIVLLISWSATAHAQADAPATATDGWWDTHYLVDYGLIAGGAAAFVIAHQLTPNPKALFGPQFDPDNPTEILDDKYADRLGRQHADETTVTETFPEAHLILLVGGLTGALALEEAAVWAFDSEGSAQRFHDTMIGFAESLALTAGVTEISKVLVGRLRPDFQDRARRYICQTDSSTTIDCTNAEPLGDTADEAEDEFVDGRKSFFSGHSSFGLNFTTYLALTLGGNFVWNPNATRTGRALGILGQTLLMTTGLFIAGSRLDDGFHHVTDVLVGSTIGFGLANFAYWRRFGGQSKRGAVAESMSVSVSPIGPPALSLSFAF